MRAPSLLALGFTGVLLSMPLQAAPEYEKRADLSDQLAQWVKQALGGDASAQRELAQRYYDGDGVEQDYAKAFELYSEAAEQGDAAAEFSVAYMYDFGEGVELDDLKAVEYYTRAAEQGHAAAQFNLALMYDEGEGVPVDDLKAID